MRRAAILAAAAWTVAWALCAQERAPEGDAPWRGMKAGVATRDVTPDGPIWLCGYASRNRPSDKVESKLRAGALAFEDRSGERIAILTLDNCEVNGAFMAPVLDAIEKEYELPQDRVITVPSHTHSGPCLQGVLPSMFTFPEPEQKKVIAYSEVLRNVLVEVVGAALRDLRPAVLAYGTGRAGFAMNRRVYTEDRVDFGENPDGPVDRDVPVLRIAAPGGELRAILFGYACHGTTVAGGDEFYWISGDYMGYACEYLEAAFPGATALYLPGFGADTNPSPRATLAHARQHGLELAGAVTGVLSRPMQPVGTELRYTYARIDLPLAPGPGREKLEADAADKNPYIRNRAGLWLTALDAGEELPKAVDYPLAVARLGDEISFVFMAGEVVADYAVRIKRELAADNPWTVGYAFEVPCYIPSMRILKEGGYEADSSLIYYGLYGPFLGRIETTILERVREMARGLRSSTAGAP